MKVYRTTTNDKKLVAIARAQAGEARAAIAVDYSVSRMTVWRWVTAAESLQSANPKKVFIGEKTKPSVIPSNVQDRYVFVTIAVDMHRKWLSKCMWC